VTALKWYEPEDRESAWAIAQKIAKSSIAPKHLRQPEDAFVAMAMGAELGLSPMASMRAIYVVHGMPSMSADSMVGLVRARGDVTQWDYEQLTEDRVVLTAARGGGKALTLEWTTEMAKRAGLLQKGGTWANYRRTMLKHRVDTEMCRALWPDIVHGYYEPDEARSIAAQAEPAPVAIDLAAIPSINTGLDRLPARVIDAEPEPAPLETHVPLEKCGIHMGSSMANSCRSAGITTPEELWAAIQEDRAPSRVAKKTVDALREMFGEPEPEPEPEPAPAGPVPSGALVCDQCDGLCQEALGSSDCCGSTFRVVE
jgi:hypothetical protein